MTRRAAITLTLVEREGYVEVDSFVTAACALRVILRELDGAMSGRRRESLRWGVGGLRPGSVALEAVAVPEGEMVVDPDAIVGACVEGLDALEKRPQTPRFFTERALLEAKTLVGLLHGSVRRIAVRGGQRQVLITQHLAANVDAILDRGYTAPASVEGRLDSVSIHDRSVFGLWESVARRRVECHFPREMLDQVREALGRRVLVSGIVRFGQGDQPLSVQVRRIRVFPAEEQLPSTEQLRGMDPDFTGEADSTTYVRGLYDG